LKFLRFKNSEALDMSHIKYTICRSGTYYYNRRVPKNAVAAYGQFIRCQLTKDPLDPPPQKSSAPIVRKWRIKHGNQTT